METKSNISRPVQRSWRFARSHSDCSGARAADGMHWSPLTSTNFSRSLPRMSSKKLQADVVASPRRSPSSKENAHGVRQADAVTPRLEFGVVVKMTWEMTRRRRRSCVGDDAGRGGVLREMMTRRKEEPEKEETAHRVRVLTARLLQWRFANARMEKALARAKSAAENKLFYTWLRVAELRNIMAAKRIVAQRRRQKLKLARLLRPQLPLLSSWEPLARPHADSVADLGRVLSAACTSLPLADGAQADLALLQETMFTSVGAANEIEANGETFYSTANVISTTLGELLETMQQEIEGLEEAMRLSRIVTSLQFQEISLRANLIQAKQKLDLEIIPKPPIPGWCF